MSPALPSRFSTTEPPGKPIYNCTFCIISYYHIYNICDIIYSAYIITLLYIIKYTSNLLLLTLSLIPNLFLNIFISDGEQSKT